MIIREYIDNYKFTICPIKAMNLYFISTCSFFVLGHVSIICICGNCVLIL